MYLFLSFCRLFVVEVNGDLGIGIGFLFYLFHNEFVNPEDAID